MATTGGRNMQEDMLLLTQTNYVYVYVLVGRISHNELLYGDKS